jgi:hypothetical protein
VSTTDTRYRDRIVGHGELAPADLVVNPLNWRQHPLHQRQALRDLLDRVGWVQQVVVNRSSGNLVDGHLRAQLALEDNEPSVPVLYVELTEEEERLVLASLDPLAALAVPDVEQLQALLGELPALEGDLGGMLDDLIGQFTATTSPGAAGADPADERDFWPVIRLQVSYNTFRAFEGYWEGVPGEDDDEKIRHLLDG